MIAFVVRKYPAVFSFSVLLVLMGVISYMGLPRESTPEIKQPYIFVTTVYSGVSAKDVENLVTRTIEDEIDGLEGISSITSSSQQSLSFITVEFTSDVEVETALRRVRERVDIAKTRLPSDVDEPSVKELSSSAWPIFIAILSHPDGLSTIDKAADKLKDELERITGILEVSLAGKLEKELRIDIDPDKLIQYNLTMGKVIGAIQNENITIPGGLLENEAKNFSLAVTGEIKDPALFEEIIVSDKSVKVRLRDVGRARFTWAEPETYSRFNGNPCISISLSKRPGVNMVDVVDEAKELIGRMKPAFPSRTKIDYSYDGAQDIKEMVADLENNMFSGFVLVLLVTIFFLGGVNSLFVSMAIPFSMLLSFTILDFMGITLNMVVLFSLILALGMLVDNGIVIVENIYRHGAMGKSRVQAAIDGAREVAGPIIASTVTTCLAFFPIIFMPGVMGDFMSFLPKTVIVVLSSSLLVALVINPVFCARFLRISEKNRRSITEGSGLFAKIQREYQTRVETAIRHPKAYLGISFVVVIAGFALYGVFGKESIFFPHLDPENAVVHIETPQGTPLDRTDQIVKEIEKIVPTAPGPLKNYQATTGRGGGDRFGGGGKEYHKANIRVGYKSFLERKDFSGAMAVDSLKATLTDITGADVRVEELEHGPPTGNPISFRIIGFDYAKMGAYADTILGILRKYRELKLIDTDYEPAKPEISIEIDRKKAAFFGLSTRDIASTIRNTMNGATIGKFRKDEDEYDIVIRYAEDFRNSIAQLANLRVANRDKDRVPLSTLAELKIRSETGVIKRKDLQRSIEVWANFKEGVQSKARIKKEIETTVHKISFPPEYRVESGEGEKMRNEASKYLVKAFIIAVFLIVIVLIAQFNSILDPLIIATAVFMSVGGVFWGYLLTGKTFVVIMSGIGCIALAGVAVNNCIVLIDYTNLLIGRGMDYRRAIVEAGRTRLRPVLLTAITTILGLIPMAAGVSFDVHVFAIQVGSESSEFWRAFAWAMIYGLSFATVMTLIMVPCLLAIKFRLFPPQPGRINSAE